jgi:hypothetical protein
MDSPCRQVLAKAPVEENALGVPNPAAWNGAIWNGVNLETMWMSLRSFLVDRLTLAAHLEDWLIDAITSGFPPSIPVALSVRRTTRSRRWARAAVPSRSEQPGPTPTD